MQTKMHGMVNTEERRAAFQRDLDRLQKWTDQKLMMFIENKCQVLSLAWTRPMQQCTLGAIWMESSFAEKNLGNPDGQRVKDETAVCRWRIEGQLHTGLH